MKMFAVISPGVEEVVPIMDDGSGPSEYFCYYVEVEADTRREAKAKAVKHPDFRGWVDEQRGAGCSPFTGLRVTELHDGEPMGEFKP